MNKAIFLHVTDPHLDGGKQPVQRDDHKVSAAGIRHKSREELVTSTFARIAEHLSNHELKLDGVIVSGDAADKSGEAGHKSLLYLILKYFSDHGISCANIVATPGNHDVVRGSEPGSEERYKYFTNAWRSAGCVTPWLDGLDEFSSPTRNHSLLSPTENWLIMPINSSNWSQMRLQLPSSAEEVFSKIISTPGLPPELTSNINLLVDKLLHADMARISEDQLEYTRNLLTRTKPTVSESQVKIAVIHHHLNSPGVREEIKAFADLTNLSLFRKFIREQKIDVVLHGHKHESAIYYDYIDDEEGANLHRTLVISAGSLLSGSDGNPARLITLDGLPEVPEITVQEFNAPRGGIEKVAGRTAHRKLWRIDDRIPGGPIVIQGGNIDVLYHQAMKVVGGCSTPGTVIVHFDADDVEPTKLPLPAAYVVPEAESEDDRQKWLSDLVSWWQEPHSKLAARLPQAHGARLRRFGGKLDQIARITKLLRDKTTTRAIAILLDPFVDFEAGGVKEEFASFCLVQFSRRTPTDVNSLADPSGPSSKPRLDCVAYYRAQEFRQWWPINMAELRLIQRQVSAEIGAVPGRITTIAADARFRATAPTQAIVPIVDRWADHSPETLHILANVLCQRTQNTGRQKGILKEWMLFLRAQILATEQWNPDGMPVALEGLQTLVSYLKSEDPLTPNTGELIETLNTQISLNKAWERSRREHEDFKSWAQDSKESLTRLLLLSKAMC